MCKDEHGKYQGATLVLGRDATTTSFIFFQRFQRGLCPTYYHNLLTTDRAAQGANRPPYVCHISCMPSSTLRAVILHNITTRHRMGPEGHPEKEIMGKGSCLTVHDGNNRVHDVDRGCQLCTSARLPPSQAYRELYCCVCCCHVLVHSSSAAV